MFYDIVTFCIRIIFKLLFPYRLFGKENIPDKGNFIICANHTSWFDPPLVGSVCKNKHIHFMAKEELFDIFIFGWLLNKLGAFPVKRNSADRRALRKGLQLLAEGKIIGLFPEGKRIRGKELGQPSHGAALIALLSEKPILPVAVKWPGKIFCSVRVSFGKLIYFEKEKIKKDNLEKVSSKIMEEIALLLNNS